jgi:hypothetical protein
MTEYELVDALNGMTSNLLAGQAVYLTMLSAYVVIAYVAGKNLSIYQVSFINLVFLVFMTVSFFTAWTSMTRVFEVSNSLNELTGVDPQLNDIGEKIGIGFVYVRLVLTVGALMFMWQIRHTKDE